MSKEGVVAAVCMSSEHGYPTYPQTCIAVGMLGTPGDAHSGELRESFKVPGTFKYNDRPYSIVADEVRLYLNATLGLSMEHGDFNEQIVVTGLGDLGDVEIGSRLVFSGGVILEIVDRAYPCEKLKSHNQNNKKIIKTLAQKSGKEIYSRRGVLAKVVQTGQLSPGETVRVETPVTI